MAWEIRKARIEDCADVKMIEREARLSEWTEEDYRREAVREGSIFLIASGTGAGPTAGFLIMRLITNEERPNGAGVSSFEAEILNIAVRTEFRRMRIAKTLVSNAISQLGNFGKGVIHLEVRARNDAAAAFYKSLGFEICGRRPHFYTAPPDDAILMSRHI